LVPSILGFGFLDFFAEGGFTPGDSGTIAKILAPSTRRRIRLFPQLIIVAHGQLERFEFAAHIFEAFFAASRRRGESFAFRIPCSVQFASMT